MAAFSTTSARLSRHNRTLSIRVTPPPVTFAERRSILHVLEQHGGVEYFQAVPGHDSMYVSLMKDDESVSTLITRSPLSYGVSVPKSVKETHLADLTKPESLARSQPVTKLKTVEAGNDAGSSNQGEGEKNFTLHIWPNLEYNHNRAARKSPLHIAWPDYVLKRPSVWTKTLQQSVPDNVAAVGLSHWHPDLGKQKIDDAIIRKKNDRFHMYDWVPSKLKSKLGKSTVDSKNESKKAAEATKAQTTE